MSCFDTKDFAISEQIEVPDEVRQYMNPVFWDYINFTLKTHQALGNCANILRLQTHRIFPHLDKVLWLDVDMIVQGMSSSFI